MFHLQSVWITEVYIATLCSSVYMKCICYSYVFVYVQNIIYEKIHRGIIVVYSFLVPYQQHVLKNTVNENTAAFYIKYLLYIWPERVFIY